MRPLPPAYPVAAVVAAAGLLPIVVLVILAAGSQQVFDPRTLAVLLNTLALTGLSVFGAVLIGVPLALITAYAVLPGRRLWLILLAAPLAMPSYLGAFTFYAAFGPGGELESLLGFGTPQPRGLPGAAIVMTLYTYPFVLLTTQASLRSLDASVMDAARVLGLSPLQALFSVVLPRVRNGVAAGAVLVALYALSDFGTPAIMGLDTYTRVIFVEYNAFGLAQAAMLSLQLLVIVGLVLLLEARVGSEFERPSQSLRLVPGPGHAVGIYLAVATLVGLTILLPLGVFGSWLARDGLQPFDSSLAWNSASAALLAALFAALLAVPVAFAAMAGPAGRMMERLTYVGFGVPGIVLGTALVYVGLQLPVLYQTLGLLVAAYVLRFLPLAVGAVRTTAERLDPALVQAARLLGASRMEAYRRITLPLTARGLLAGAALVFLEAMRELPATLLLRPTGFETLATELWRVYEAGYFGQGAVTGLVLILLSMAGLALMMSGDRSGPRGVLREVDR